MIKIKTKKWKVVEAGREYIIFDKTLARYLYRLCQDKVALVDGLTAKYMGQLLKDLKERDLLRVVKNREYDVTVVALCPPGDIEYNSQREGGTLKIKG